MNNLFFDTKDPLLPGMPVTRIIEQEIYSLQFF